MTIQFKASKSLGQNFLFDQNVIKKIIKLSNISPKDTILEIGPGTGYLTKELAKNCRKIIAIEKDQRLISILQENLQGYQNISLINQDILIYNPKIKNYIIVANLPYNISNLIIRKFLTIKNPPQKMILLVQKEVAQRICANSDRMNLLAICVQSLAKVKILSSISKNCFSPRPKVDGAILELTPEKKDINYELFFKIVKAGFSHPRKKLVNNLKNVLKLDNKKIGNWLMKNNLNLQIRAEKLNLSDWINLTNNFPL